MQRDLRALVAAPGGPPGAIVTLYRNGRTTVLRAGVSQVGTHRAPRATDHMRIASIAKAFSAAIVLQLVDQRRLGLGDTLARRDPDTAPGVGARHRPSASQSHEWTAGLHRVGRLSPPGRNRTRLGTSRRALIISWVASERLRFVPGSRYRYSNTDNIVAGLIAERVTGRS